MRRRRHEQVEPAPEHRPDRSDEKGLDEARAALDYAMSMWPDVHEVAAEIRGIRRRNQLADKVMDALGGHRR